MCKKKSLYHESGRMQEDERVACLSQVYRDRDFFVIKLMLVVGEF